MKFKTKNLLLALLILIVLILAVFVCLKLSQHNQNNDGPSVAVSNNEDDTIPDDEGDPIFRELSNDVTEYLAVVCAENNIDLDIDEVVSIGGYYDYKNVLIISFYVSDGYFDDRMLLSHNVAYYIQDWINANYSDEELPLYRIECYRGHDNWSMLVEGYIDFANYDCWYDRDAKPARSMYCVDLQVNYTEENYEGLSFDGITFLRTSNAAERMVEDYSVLKHFPDLERVVISMLISKTDEEIEAFIEEIKQYLPPDCEIEIDQY